MKKILYYSSLVLMLAATSGCEKYEVDGTATQNLSGDWWVKWEYFDTDDNDWVDITGYLFGVERFLFNTYNTAANVPTEIFVDDNKNSWEIKGKVKADAANLTFGSPDPVLNLTYEDSEFIVTDGKVVKGVGRSKTGVKTDSIIFILTLSDDDGLIYDNAWETQYRISGHRRTGFQEDEY
jgi:hypothetical protein